jgi:hypothetical protein
MREKPKEADWALMFSALSGLFLFENILKSEMCVGGKTG